MSGERFISCLNVQTQPHLSSGGRHIAVSDLAQIAGNESEQIGGLREGVLPDNLMPGGIVRQNGGHDFIPIGQKHRKTFSIRLDPHAVATQHIRTIRMESDASKPLGLALGCQHSAAFIQALEGSVRLGVKATDRGQGERLCRRFPDHKLFIVQLIGAAVERLPIKGN